MQSRASVNSCGLFHSLSTHLPTFCSAIKFSMTFFPKPCINFSKGILCILGVHSIAVQGIDKFCIFPNYFKIVHCIALPQHQSINVFSDGHFNILLYEGVVYSNHMLELVLCHTYSSILIFSHKYRNRKVLPNENPNICLKFVH